jgi:hypothetical protein
MASLVSLYEAFAVYSFMGYLTTFLAMEYDMVAVLQTKPQTKHMIPFCFLQSWKMGREFWQLCRFGVYQYTALNLVVTIIALSCEFGGKYEEGEFSGSNPWLYLIITTNISQIWALYCLVLFYKATKEELQPIKPLGKFLCIKAVVFFSFWLVLLILSILTRKRTRVSQTAMGGMLLRSRSVSHHKIYLIKTFIKINYKN